MAVDERRSSITSAVIPKDWQDPWPPCKIPIVTWSASAGKYVSSRGSLFLGKKQAKSIFNIVSFRKIFSRCTLCVQSIYAKNRILREIEAERRMTVDRSNEQHLKLLVALWRGLKGSKADPPPIPAEEWKELGFQGTDPCTDFRAMGLAGLKQLLAFTQTCKDCKIIYREAQYGPYWYSFAIVGINIGKCLVELLEDGQLDLIVHRSSEANEMKQAIQLLYNEFVAIFHRSWMQAKPDNLFAFNYVMARSKMLFLSSIQQ